MNPLSINEITDYVKNNIGKFHDSRLTGLEKLDFDKILKRKNPYLYKVKNLGVAHDIVKEILDAHISSSEETKFGDWLEEMAIFLNNKVYGGMKSSASGIDLEFVKEDIRYLVSIKSGPNWCNSSQLKKMISDFAKARNTLHTSNSRIKVICVNGCCYGRSDDTIKDGEYYKYCGQKFWEFITGMPNLYLDIIEPLGHKAKEKNEHYNKQYNALVNQITHHFIHKYCNDNGEINWVKIVKMNSGITKE